MVKGKKVPLPGDQEAVGHIKNKLKRQEVYGRIKKQKKDIKKAKKEQRKKDAEDPEKKNLPKPVPKTLDNMREADETILVSDDEEIRRDEDEDEFRKYFDGEQPRTMITTNNHPSKPLIQLTRSLLELIPGSYYYSRRDFSLKDICVWAAERGFTNLIVLGQGLQLKGHKRNPCSLILVHLPEGPTMTFRLSSVKLPDQIRNHAKATKHKPELILNQFSTRLGMRVSRGIASLFPQDPEFTGRRVVTFHNQRDYIFVRHHRYIFPEDKKGEKARLQEIGPRFTLKLKSVQSGAFDASRGEYEWVHKKENDTSKKRFFL